MGLGSSRVRRGGHPCPGNGSSIRTTAAAIYFAREGMIVSVDAALRISALSHSDPAAGDGCAVFHRMLLAAVDDADAIAEINAAVNDIPAERRAKCQTVLAAGWTPEQATEPNGAVSLGAVHGIQSIPSPWTTGCTAAAGTKTALQHPACGFSSIPGVQTASPDTMVVSL